MRPPIPLSISLTGFGGCTEATWSLVGNERRKVAVLDEKAFAKGTKLEESNSTSRFRADDARYMH
jgi:hypothetical protein